MMPERAFRNSIALSLLLLGLALIFYSIGGVLAFVADAGTLSLAGAALYDTVFRVAVLVIALLYFFIGLSLIRSRPHVEGTNAAPQPASVVGPAALVAARVFSVILFMLGLILLFNFTPYGRDSTLAAVMVVAGVFGVAATILYRRPDPNLAAVGAVMSIIAAALLLYAQLTVQIPDEPSNTYGAWETTNLVVPPLLGPIAIMIAGICGVAYAYVRSPRFAHGVFIGLGVAGLVYGVGLILVSLASVFDIPWYQFAQGTGNSVLLLLTLTAGTALLIAAGVCCVVASLISFVRGGNRLRTAPSKDELAARNQQLGVPTATTTTGRPIAEESTANTRAQATSKTVSGRIRRARRRAGGET